MTWEPSIPVGAWSTRMEGGIHVLYMPVEGKVANCAGFMSGSGTNLERVLEHEKMLGADSPFRLTVIVTDDPDCNATNIAKAWDRELVVADIGAFHKKKRIKKWTLKTVEGRQARAKYTAEVRNLLKPYDIDFGIFGGFEPMTNIMVDFPCLNIHPGDLTYLVNGERFLVGLHTVPIEAAIKEGLTRVRSSVILAMPYEGNGSNMDDGAIVGLGPEYDITGADKSKPKDIQNRLKEVSDWQVLPVTVEAVAGGHVAVDFTTNKAYVHDNGSAILMPVTNYME